MIPIEVLDAAKLLGSCARDEASRMRASGVSGPAVLLLELVDEVCENFLRMYAC